LLFSLGAGLLLTTHRLPAPIVEEATPTPKPKRPAVSETESPPRKRAGSKPAPTPKVSFVGAWNGTVSGEMHAPLSSPSYSDTYHIQISPDEKTVNWTASKWLGAKFQAPVQKNGRTLRWSYEKHDIAGHTVITASLQMDANGTATFSEKSEIVGGWFKGSGYTVTGTLVRQ
jgi:hypothetical protein